MREVITTANAPSSPHYSQAVKAGQHIFVSGLVGIDVSTGSLAGPTIQEQTRQALRNCEAILDAAGATLQDVVEVGVLLTDPTDFDGMNEELCKLVPGRATHSLRRQARRRHPECARLDPHDGVRRLVRPLSENQSCGAARRDARISSVAQALRRGWRALALLRGQA